MKFTSAAVRQEGNPPHRKVCSTPAKMAGTTPARRGDSTPARKAGSTPVNRNIHPVKSLETPEREKIQSRESAQVTQQRGSAQVT